MASHGTQHMAITVSDKLLQQSAENLSKIRSTLRYLNGVVGESANNAVNSSPIDKQIYLNRYLLNKLYDFENEVRETVFFFDKRYYLLYFLFSIKVFNLYDCYEYNRVVANIQNFVTNQISAIYVHLIKDRLYCGTPKDIEDIKATLEKCYTVLCKSLWPIAPFLVEESWSYYRKFSKHIYKCIYLNVY